MNKRPPKYPLLFFRLFCNPDYVEDIEGDLLERFEKRTNLKRPSRWLFTMDVLRLFRPGIIRNFEGTKKLNYYGMLKNYFITSLRFIKREKTFAMMNISGLALGIACAIVIYKIIAYDLSYDKHQENYANLYRVVNEDVTTEGTSLWSGQVHPLAQALRNDFPSLQAAMTFYDKDGLIGIDDGAGNIKRYQETKGVVFVEPQFLELFTVKLIHGDTKSALSEPGKVILSRSKAKNYFGVSDDNLHLAIGRSILLENKKTTFVSAVMEDFPPTTDFPFEVIFHYQDQDAANPWFYNGQDWDEYNSATNCYVMLDEGITPQEMEVQLRTTVEKYLPEHTSEKRTYRLQPLSELHFSDRIRQTYAGITATDDELIILGLVGLFLIITACINFVNLSTAQAVKRSKEVGVRKTMGSGKRQLIVQFICEAFIITLLASALALGLASYLIDKVGQVLSYDLSLSFDLNMSVFLTALVVGVTILSGLYPSFVLAKMNPVLAIKNTLNVKQTSGFLSLRRALVVLQFAISQILIIGILVLNTQMKYLQTKDLGFNEESIVMVKLPANDSTNLSVLKNELMQHSQIKNVSFSTSGPMAEWRSTNPIFHPNIDGQDMWGNLKNVDQDFFDVYELEIIAGEPFVKGSPRNHCVVNRKLTEALGFTNPVDALGESVQYGRGTLQLVIVAVAEDFHAASLHADLENVFLANLPWNIFQAGIKLNTSEPSYAEIKLALEHIEESWQTSFPEHVFDFQFYDDKLATFYELERSVSKVMKLFVTIAIIIGALGLYGLVAFMANQKTKEIGIRKVMGASEFTILNILSKELVTLLFIAFLISGPVAYYLMNAFLNGYANRIPLGPGVFILAVCASIAIALLTVGYKATKVAKANPILSLRDE